MRDTGVTHPEICLFTRVADMTPEGRTNVYCSYFTHVHALFGVKEPNDLKEVKGHAEA